MTTKAKSGLGFFRQTAYDTCVNVFKRIKSTVTGASVKSELTFSSMGLSPQILKALAEQGYTEPTPIQAAAIPPLLGGRDLLGCAQTGTGKTAAFALPTLDRLKDSAPQRHPQIKVLALTPTRELALQVSESYKDYGRYLRLKTAVIFGGVSAEQQRRTLGSGVDILVATPGRLLDLHSQGVLNFDGLTTFILDEADRMLDMGFLPDVKRIIRLLPKKRQNILLSATMPDDIQKLSMALLDDPVKVEVARVSQTADRVDQCVYLVNRDNKRALLLHVLQDPSMTKVLVFTRTKAIANRITKLLVSKQISSEAIHGNKSQNARQRALTQFKSGKIRVLVASDLAARGLDVEDISHVINYDIPNIPETYVHRIGRTGRAQASGKAISFCDGEERPFLTGIERVIQEKIPVIEDHPFPFVPGQDPPLPGMGANARGRSRTGGRPPQSSSHRGRRKK